MTRERLLIVGNGMAGDRLLDELLVRSGPDRYEITVLGEEPRVAYNRILLSKVLGGQTPDAIHLKDRDWYDAHGIAFRPGERAESIDAAAKRLTTEGGETLTYDRLVLATGSVPIVPPIPGLKTDAGAVRPGVFVFRTVEDCLAIRAAATTAKTAIVLGGGLLGLEAARGLSELGIATTVLQKAGHLMNVQLDVAAGAALQARIEAMGMAILNDADTQAIVARADLGLTDGAAPPEAVAGMRLADGRVVPCDVLVMACGVRPRVDLAQRSGLPVERGILVDDHLAVEGVPDVFAVGECCQHRGVCYGIVAPLWEQAGVLAGVLMRPDRPSDGGTGFAGAKVHTKLKVAGVDVASMGAVDADEALDDVVEVHERKNKVYRKLIIRDGRLRGAQFVGDGEAAARVLAWFDRGDPLPASPLDLFASDDLRSEGGSTSREVCNCNRVGEQTIRDAIAGGCSDVAAVGRTTKAGTGCGSCRGLIAAMLEKSLATA